ncbi:AMP-binding protein [Actinomadura scrupuli]|uniref:AMP-binding protein n=1 Tax=Actinomadura scrupuli TaxID=559629 RepID=UPI003D98FACF
MESGQDTFARLLMARADDDHPGLLFEDERHSWAEVVQAARTRAAFAAGRAARERPGGRPLHIGVLLDNVPEYVFWIGAAALAGATLVGINPTRRGAELAADIRHTDCDLIVTDAEHAVLLEGLDTGVAPGDVLLTGSGPDGDDGTGPPPGRPAGTDSGPYAEVSRIAPGDRLLLLFTSGSTGAPKAVACSQGRLAAIAGRADLFDITRDSVTYVAMPLFHGNAIMANLAMAVGTGATVVLRRRFSASGFLPDVRRYGVTFFNYVGRALAYILATPEGAGDAVNTLHSAFGTEASAQDMARFGARFGCRVIDAYGSSEGAISMHRADGCPPDALGLPQQGVEVAILDPASGAECPRARFDEAGGLLNPGEAVGEIVGLNVAGTFEGYYNNAEAESRRVRPRFPAAPAGPGPAPEAEGEGVYWSGDLGYRDEAGYFYFAGRDSDWLRVDSENFAAAPVERILSRWAPVVMCAVYPVPDPRTGDQVMAALEIDGEFDPGAFAEFLGAQADLGTKWAPRFVRVIDAMPLTSTNKVDKRPLRAERWECAGRVWWRPGREPVYRPLTPALVAALRAEFAAHGRRHVLSGM